MKSRYLSILLALPLLAGCTTSRQASCEQRTDPMMPAYLAGLACANTQQAQYEVGLAYETGTGIAADPEEAARWYHKAARFDSGTTPLFLEPTGDEKFGAVVDHRIGPILYGIADAKYRLGLMYIEGRGVKASRSKAKKWLKRAAKQGHEGAAEALERLKAET